MYKQEGRGGRSSTQSVEEAPDCQELMVESLYQVYTDIKKEPHYGKPKKVRPRNRMLNDNIFIIVNREIFKTLGNE